MFIGLESSGVAHSFRSAMLVEDRRDQRAPPAG
jgi:hypothetical protein